MSKQLQATSAKEPDGGNPHIRFRGGPRQGDRPGLLNKRKACGARQNGACRARQKRTRPVTGVGASSGSRCARRGVIL